jgi:hypothetical protein
MYTLRDAISHIRYGAEFSIVNDLEIIWHDTNQTQPTQSEIDAAFISLENAETQKVADKTALLAKLGITEEEAALLLGGN